MCTRVAAANIKTHNIMTKNIEFFPRSAQVKARMRQACHRYEFLPGPLGQVNVKHHTQSFVLLGSGGAYIAFIMVASSLVRGRNSIVQHNPPPLRPLSSVAAAFCSVRWLRSSAVSAGVWYHCGNMLILKSCHHVRAAGPLPFGSAETT